jgi:hypothetical protein
MQMTTSSFFLSMTSALFTPILDYDDDRRRRRRCGLNTIFLSEIVRRKK